MEQRREGARERWIADRGEIVFLPSVGNVFAYEVSGHFTVEMVRLVFQRVDAWAAGVPGRLVAFANYQRLERYDSRVRVEATEFFKQRLARYECFHVLVTSKLVAMGLSTLAMLSGLRVKTYADLREYELALRSACSQARGSVSPR